jgi:hypothetical protein
MKRNKMLTITAVIAALLLTIGTGFSIAKGGFGMHGPGMMNRAPLLRCINKLNLSAETKNAINTLVQANKESLQTEFKTTKTLMDSYNKVLTTSPLDENALVSAQQALLSQRQTGMQSHFDLDKSIVKLLNKDELAALATCLSSDTQQTSSTGTVGAGQ